MKLDQKYLYLVLGGVLVALLAWKGLEAVGTALLGLFIGTASQRKADFISGVDKESDDFEGSLKEKENGIVSEAQEASSAKEDDLNEWLDR